MKKINYLLIGAGITTAAVILADPTIAQAGIAGIEAGGKKIHGIVTSVGKWVIIVKGTVDCIQSVLSGDVPKAKQQFFGYLLCFGIMLCLPWSLDEMEGMFK